MPALFPEDSDDLLAIMDQPPAPGGCQVFRCPGCAAWTVEYDDTVPPDMDSHPRFDEDFKDYVALVHAAELAAHEHRAECPAFAALAALSGVPLVPRDLLADLG